MILSEVYRVNQRNYFHEDKGCRKLEYTTRRIQTWDKEEALAWGHEPCSVCCKQKPENPIQK